MLGQVSRAWFLRFLGLGLAVVGLAVALAWDPMTCVTNMPACPTPVPGSAPCGPPVASCTSEYVALRVAIVVASIGAAILLIALGSRDGRARPAPLPS